MEKRGLTGRLEAAGISGADASEAGTSEAGTSEAGTSEAGTSGADASKSVFFGDEMRLGLIGQVRRRWAPRGVKLRQPVEFTYKWTYLNLAVNPMEGILKWDWTSDMKAESIAPVLKKWEGDLEAIVWDGARGHQGSEYDEVEACRIQQPPYSPELQPAERIFQYLRARIEGIVYGELEAKKEAVERELRTLASCREKVRSLTCWDWIEKALTQLAGKQDTLR